MSDTPLSPAPQRRILHVDVDAMFVQCAVMADPEGLADEPLILVGGSAEGRGVVTSASYACRAFGVRSAMPTATALRLCPAARVVPVPGAMVRAKSRELRSVLRDWAPVAVMASVDEAYLDLTGTEALYRGASLREIALRIQSAVGAATGLDVSIGGGSNRLVAKLATSFAKPRGVYVVPPGGEDAFVGGLEIGDLIGVGPALEEELRRRGITSMAALRVLDEATMASWWNPERARWLWRRCRGMDDSLVAEDEGTKSVSSETTFARDLSSDDLLEEALLGQVVDAAAALRGKGLYARTVTVKLRDSDFRDRSRGKTLEAPVQTESAIFRVARELLSDLRRQRHTSARLIGVSLTGLSETADGAQHTLLEVAPPPESERERALARASDALRARFGKEAIRPGRLLPDVGRREP